MMALFSKKNAIKKGLHHATQEYQKNFKAATETRPSTLEETA
jgi:hypothetical protein